VEHIVVIHYLINLHVVISGEENHQVLLIHANGYSLNAQAGVPKLVLKERKAGSREGILEFDFVVTPAEVVKRTKLNWEVETVFDVSQFPLVPNWIKVNAARNADIAMVEIKLPDE